jgi:hypothetical protein
MPSLLFPDRVEKSRTRSTSSTERRYRTAANIERVGQEAMAPCSSCQKNGDLCLMMAGVATCGPCTRKNRRGCDGQFSQGEFDNLEAQKQRLKKEALDKRAEIARKARELIAAEQQLSQLESRLEGLSRQQSDMVRREVLALESISEMEGYSEEPSSSVLRPEGELVAFDDAQWEELLAMGTSQGDPSLSLVES